MMRARLPVLTGNSSSKFTHSLLRGGFRPRKNRESRAWRMARLLYRPALFQKMTHRITVLFLALTLAFTGCDKVKKLTGHLGAHKEAEAAAATPTPAPAPVATPTPAPTPVPKPVVDKNSQVIVFCYHRQEGGKLGAMSMDPAAFEQHMQQLKDAGIAVISMQDFLAWRRGEKSIPPKCAVVTFDDGYVSNYNVAWPIMKKFGYPFTMYVYTKFVASGGKSITWEQLEEMRDAGVDIGCHSLTHSDLRSKKGRTPADYEAFVRAELADSKKIIEQKLGISVATFAYPFGNHNDVVRRLAAEAGYEAAFTVYGQKIGFGGDAMQLGRYAIEQAKPQVFQAAINFASSGASTVYQAAPVTMAASGSSMKTTPAEGETIGNPTPLLSVDLTDFGDFDPASIEMRLSGFGIVPAKYDAATKTASCQMTRKLRDKSYSVIVSAKAGGRKVEARWSFNFDPTKAASAPAH
jgi:peptidoglycan/xylan/chitin deacetylase (PgdA/CDA1 family)